MNGINIQYPWSKLIAEEEKCVETRSYPLPEKYIGVELAIIETPGKSSNFKSRVIGTVTFSHSFKYNSCFDWESDYNRHLVSSEDKDYGWNDKKEKHGWVVCNVKKFDNPLPLKSQRGIVFRKDVI